MVEQRAPDLVITGGRVIDPGSRTDALLDLAIVGDRIVAIGPAIDATRAAAVIDASGAIVTPGLIDLHVHAYRGVSVYGADVDPICRATGVTTAVDAGSAGSVNFGGFEEFIAAPATTRLLAFVALAKHGVTNRPGELVDLAYADPKGAAATVRDHREIAVGIKVRLAEDRVEGNARAALRLAIEAGAESNSPVMVHIGETPISIEEIVSTLRPGDIVTHCYTPLAPSITDEAGRLRPAVLEAHHRGVLFDVGHAGGHFDFTIVRACLAAGLPPDVISTDLHRMILESRAALDLPVALSKLLALGMDLRSVIAAATVAPAAAIGWSDRLGQLAVGREADVAVLRLSEEAVVFQDTEGNQISARQLLRPLWTVRAGAAFAAPVG